jgi:hypothetical protein
MSVKSDNMGGGGAETKGLNSYWERAVGARLEDCELRHSGVRGAGLDVDVSRVLI